MHAGKIQIYKEITIIILMVRGSIVCTGIHNLKKKNEKMKIIRLLRRSKVVE